MNITSKTISVGFQFQFAALVGTRNRIIVEGSLFTFNVSDERQRNISCLIDDDINGVLRNS